MDNKKPFSNNRFGRVVSTEPKTLKDYYKGLTKEELRDAGKKGDPNALGELLIRTEN
jgi:hypothetical protein